MTTYKADLYTSIRAKLTDEELEWLRSRGLEIDPAVVAAKVELEVAMRQLEHLESVGRRHEAQSGRCAFCNRSKHAAGPMAESEAGTRICHDCAVACAEATTRGDRTPGA